jgi:hypothetical protein
MSTSRAAAATPPPPPLRQVCPAIEQLVTQVEGCWRSVLGEDQCRGYTLEEVGGRGGGGGGDVSGVGVGVGESVCECVCESVCGGEGPVYLAVALSAWRCPRLCCCRRRAERSTAPVSFPGGTAALKVPPQIKRMSDAAAARPHLIPCPVRSRCTAAIPVPGFPGPGGGGPAVLPVPQRSAARRPRLPPPPGAPAAASQGAFHAGQPALACSMQFPWRGAKQWPRKRGAAWQGL